MGQIRGNTRTRVRGSYKDTGGVGRARKASVWTNRRKECELKEEERTECEEEHYIKHVVDKLISVSNVPRAGQFPR
jgi:hypothetical protein